MYYVYIIHSAILDKFYIGSTDDPINRLKKHNTNHKGFTGTVNDWKLVYKECFPDKKFALQREVQLKKWKNKNRIIELRA